MATSACAHLAEWDTPRSADAEMQHRHSSWCGRPTAAWLVGRRGKAHWTGRHGGPCCGGGVVADGPGAACRGVATFSLAF